MIDVKNLTLAYKNGKGIFDVDFAIKQGQVVGYLGPNGAGKTTTIRCLLGFMRGDMGSCTINNLNTSIFAKQIKNSLGYIPGEISYPSGVSGKEFLKYICELRGTTDFSLMNNLVERFELDTTGEIKRFSKGMKQKMGIVTAFMHNPEVLILDEPSSGLDPIMQNMFIELVQEEKRKGKTILLSSHMFDEIEKSCDDVLIIREGRIVARSDIMSLKASAGKVFVVKSDEISKLGQMGFNTVNESNNTCEVHLKGDDVDRFIKKLATIKVLGLDQKSQNLEDIFLNFYGKEAKKL